MCRSPGGFNPQQILNLYLNFMMLYSYYITNEIPFSEQFEAPVGCMLLKALNSESAQ